MLHKQIPNILISIGSKIPEVHALLSRLKYLGLLKDVGLPRAENKNGKKGDLFKSLCHITV